MPPIPWPIKIGAAEASRILVSRKPRMVSSVQTSSGSRWKHHLLTLCAPLASCFANWLLKHARLWLSSKKSMLLLMVAEVSLTEQLPSFAWCMIPDSCRHGVPLTTLRFAWSVNELDLLIWWCVKRCFRDMFRSLGWLALMLRHWIPCSF